MNIYKKQIMVFTLCLIGVFFAVQVTYAFTIGNFGHTSVDVQSDATSGDNSVTAKDNSSATNNTVGTGNATNQTTVCTLVNTNGGIPHCAQPTAAPTNSPTTQPTPVPATPTPTPGSSNGGGGSSGGSSSGGSSSSSSNSSSSTSAPQQAVLGASTFGSTGTFTENVMNTLLVLGFVIIGMGAISYKREQTDISAVR